MVQTYIKWKIGNLHRNGLQHTSNDILQELLQKQFYILGSHQSFRLEWWSQCDSMWKWMMFIWVFFLIGGSKWNSKMSGKNDFEVRIIIIKIRNLIVVWENCTGCPWCVSCAQLWRLLGDFLLVRSWKTIALPIFQTELSTWKGKIHYSDLENLLVTNTCIISL